MRLIRFERRTGKLPRLRAVAAADPKSYRGGVSARYGATEIHGTVSQAHRLAPPEGRILAEDPQGRVGVVGPTLGVDEVAAVCLNTSTGVMTLVGSTGQNMSGLAFTAVPEPATCTLCLVAGLGLLGAFVVQTLAGVKSAATLNSDRSVSSLIGRTARSGCSEGTACSGERQLNIGCYRVSCVALNR
jgi:hypothetical protein